MNEFEVNFIYAYLIAFVSTFILMYNYLIAETLLKKRDRRYILSKQFHISLMFSTAGISMIPIINLLLGIAGAFCSIFIIIHNVFKFLSKRKEIKAEYEIYETNNGKGSINKYFKELRQNPSEAYDSFPF